MAIKIAPGNSAQYVNLAGLAVDFDHPVEALTLIDRAISIRPGDAVALCIRAEALADLGRVDEGLAAIGLAAELGPLSDCALIVQA